MLPKQKEFRKAERQRQAIVLAKRRKLEKAAPKMAGASKRFIDGWRHFINCINFGKSNLDADAIRFMNEVPGELETAFKEATETEG